MVRKSEILLFLRSLYTVFEDLLGFGNQRKSKCGVLQVIITCSFGLLASTLCITCLLPFFLFHQALNLYLKWHVGSTYVGLLKGQDSTMECESKKLLVNLVIIINRRVSYEEFVKCVGEYMGKALGSCSKLSYLVHKCWGYYYFTKGNLKTEDYLDIVDYAKDEYITRELLHNFLMENCFDEMLLRNKMWHLTMFKQPIRWNENTNVAQQAFVCTFRHSLCDGISILGLLKNKVFQEMEMHTMQSKCEEKPTTVEHHVYKNCFLPHDMDARIKPRFQTEEFLSLFVEETVGYVPLVREVKQKLEVQFSDVLVAAIGSAIATYAKKKNIKLYRHIASVAISPYLMKNKQLLSGHFNFDNVSNHNGILHFNFPENTSITMVQKTLKVHETSQRALRASEVVISQVLTKLFYLIPTPLLSSFLDNETQPACFELSNMSAVESCVIGKSSLESAIFFTTQFFKVGFLFGVMTVGDKFQVSLKSDRGMVENQEELNEILQDVFHYLDKLIEEVRSLSANEKIK